MKVRKTPVNSSGIPNLYVKDDIRVSSGRKPDFRNQLEKAEENSYEQRLKELLNEIANQGEKLGKKVDVRELMIYKKLITEFLDMVLGKSMKFSKQSLLDRRGRHKVFALIKKIDSDLELLTKDVMDGEKDNIRILQRMDDIRGLILDLLM